MFGSNEVGGGEGLYWSFRACERIGCISQDVGVLACLTTEGAVLSTGLQCRFPDVWRSVLASDGVGGGEELYRNH